MEFYRFTSADGRARALTADRAGRALPGGFDRWALLGPMLLDEAAPRRLGVSAEHVAAHVARDGYFILPLPSGAAGGSAPA